ncbi:carbohydrate ABC transporter permease [Kocuria sp. M1R5S2]|uniref:carbohydrate ABC transporter permease n=1 Tax=Kocuria rhizosphaerae TaxID=3376285 RepID=UPI0037BAE6B1
MTNVKSQRLSKTARKRLVDAVYYLMFAVITLFFIFPLLWVLSLSLKDVPELFASPPLLFPTDPKFENYAYVFERTPVGRYLANSLLIVLSTIALVLLVAIPSAYAFSRMNFRYKRTALLLVLVFQMVSPVVVAIPLYRVFAQVDLLNSYGSLIVVYVAIGLPVATWFLRGYFDSIPRELDESATLDGCNRLQLLLKILLPLAAPGIASVAILVGVQSWSQFVIPFILLDDREMFPVSVGIINLQSTSEAITTHYLAAASLISVLPIIVIFVLLQRFIVGALTSGAVKG